ncbi:hypothetical protein RHSIM_Rhsim06G0151200 [Rhododendron simsii]|uniref:F-box domain-containing protein n=1 Tax=Rhododendron simsii TaxID=118357 RepID=A0A834GVL5_RHOSS|nr:hypothetical protein RHSIM_Rhsim06G0151200 [Rhododendron simsii]
MEATTIKRPRILKKAHKNPEEKHDPLTSLPEPLLHHILSYLTMKDVIRTSVLAKRWRYMWLYVPCLEFSPMKMSRSKEVAFINQSLLLHKGPAIQKFSLTFLLAAAETHHVDSWIYFAKTRNVNELNLDFPSSSAYYRLPHFLFSSTSLTVLSLIGCEIHFLVKFKLSSLKTLSLEQVYFSGGEINDLTASTPILESLSLTDCQRFADLYVDVPSWSKIKTIKIHESDQGSSKSVLSIFADYIASFELVTSMSRGSYFIDGMKSLESASFGCNKVNCGQYEAHKEDIVFEILDSVCSGCNEEQSQNGLSFDATCLEIRTDLTKGELPGISYMLGHSPNIKTLVISIDKIHAKSFSNNSEEGKYWKLQEPNFVDLLCNLKDVKIYNFMKNLESKQMSTPEDFLAHLRSDMNFLRFLLKNSKVMERMTITTFKNVKFGRNSESKKFKLMFQLTQELLAFPRASQAAQISFN